MKQKKVVKVTTSQIKDIVKESVEKYVQLNEGSPYTALRELSIRAQQVSLNFEDEIVKGLGLMNPDDMPNEARIIYHEAVEEMKQLMVKLTVNTAKKLVNLPKKETLQK